MIARALFILFFMITTDLFSQVNQKVEKTNINTTDKPLGTSTKESKKDLFFDDGNDITQIPYFNFSVSNPTTGQQAALSLRLLLFLSIISLAPSILILMTCFIRIFIVFDFIRRALSLQSMPPTQVLAGISLFLTIFIMWNTATKIYNDAYTPLQNGEISITQAMKNAEAPLRTFMFNQLNRNYKNIKMFMHLAKLPEPKTQAEVPTYVLIPAFALNEINIAFMMGILIFVPFIVIDIMISSILMSMGMIMLPPVTISLPFKIMLFVLVDGWTLISEQLIKSFLN